MTVTPVSCAQYPTPSRARSSVSDLWLSAVTYWYLTGLVAALGFSFGFYLVKPASGAAEPDPHFLDAFTWMDGKWYKQIATEGYNYDLGARSNVAFFPVYPLFARGLIAATGIRPEVALLILSNLSLLAALAMLMFYVRARWPDAPKQLADFTTLVAALFPTGCFFRLAYSESTFLFLAILSMYAMLRRWPLWCTALIVGMGTAARPVGVALLVPFAMHIIRTSSSPSAGGWVGESGVEERRTRRRRFALRGARLGLYLPLACWGLAAFMAFQWRAFDDPFVVFKTQEHWRIRAAVPWNEKAAALATLEPIRAVYDGGSPAFWASFDRHGIPWFSLQFVNPWLFVGSVAAIAMGAWRRWLSREEALLSALLLLIPYATRGYEMGMGSSGRFVAVVFPLYVVLGQLLVYLPDGVRSCLLVLSGFFLASLTALYAAGDVVF